MQVRELQTFLQYNPDTGVFTRLVKSRGHSIGEIAGTPLLHGHIAIGVNKKKYLAHRLAWLYMTGSWPVNQIDHIDCNPSNNTFSNLRESTQAENTQNRRKASARSQSGLLGVHWCNTHKTWIAKIMINGTNKYLGSFNNEETAFNAYLTAKRELHKFNTL